MMPLTEIRSDFSDVKVKVKIVCVRINDLYSVFHKAHVHAAHLPSAGMDGFTAQGTWMSPTLDKLLIWGGKPPLEGRVLCLYFSHTHCFAHSRHLRNISWLNEYIIKALEEIYQQKNVQITTGPKNAGSQSFVVE